MEISGAVLRRSALSSAPSSGLGVAGIWRKGRVADRPRRVAIGGGGGFSDEGHLVYYVSPVVRCGGGGGKKNEREVKKREKLVKGMTKDLAALLAVGVDAGEKGNTISEAAQMLMTELNQLRVQEKEMKRRKKEEKAAMKAAKMKDICADEESSSSSSESCDRDCESNTVIDMSSLKTNVISEEKPESPASSMHSNVLQPETVTTRKACSAKKNKVCAQDESSSSSSESSESSDSECEGETVVNMSSLKTTVIPEAKPESPASSMCAKVLSSETVQVIDKKQDSPIAQECNITSSCCSSINNLNSCVSGSRTSAISEKSTDKIEVCMGGKCKRSGAMELLQEFEKKIGIEGAVVGCKCMGKCKEGPNVRMVTQGNEENMSKGLKNPLCIGVGIEDVPTIVANFFGDEREMGFMAA